ncbi:hypothetical protein DFH07DRAFT_560708 [Mycena maculata]|uniref:F-box domain-containing protein n=1 Tax=Mycena maculata TaxID=230809 RepID=A0AAD7ITI1_9AGAR|nr:hypothetical protein DFH07DRAFT_560708 [Mycena maculata]
MASMAPTTRATRTRRMADLHVDIVLGIFYFLDGQTLVRCCSVCRAWQETVNGSTELKYMIELWADGMIPCPFSTLSPVDKLERLNQWRRAWLGLNWASRTVFRIDNNPRAYELVGGVFAQQNTWPVSDFTAIRLPSAQGGGEITRTLNVGVESLDFAMDPTQDLVVFLHKEDEIGHFACRAMSSLRPHPLAASSTLSFNLRDDSVRRIFLQIADDVIGLLFRTSQDEGSLRLILFNWRRGIELVDLVGPQFPPSVSDFAILSPRAYILASVNDCSYMPGGPRGVGEIHIYTFNGTRQNHPARVATLQLPHHNPTRYLVNMIAHSGPFCAGPLPGALFSKSNDKRICVFSLVYNGGEGYSLYVHHRYLEKYLVNEGAPPIIPWDEWGPNHSRMLPGRHRFWLRYVHGERVVRPAGDFEHSNRVEIMDFGIIPLHPGFNDEASQSPSAEMCSQPSTIPSGDVFASDVTTALPYRRSFRNTEDHHVQFLIDQDRLIGVNDAVDQLTVYTF